MGFLVMTALGHGPFGHDATLPILRLAWLRLDDRLIRAIGGRRGTRSAARILKVSDLKGMIADSKGMVTHDIPDRNATGADFLSAFGSKTARHGWSTVAADWFEVEPAAGGTRAAFLELYRRASTEQIADALEGIWLMLDRAALLRQL